MKIMNKDVREFVNFEDLILGDVFKDTCDTSIYLHITPLSVDGHYFNAINLYTMGYATFSDDDRVVRLNAELVIS